MLESRRIENTMVICDVCGYETGYTGEDSYADRDKHFCSSHSVEESLYDNLIEHKYTKVAEMLLKKAIRRAKRETRIDEERD